MAIKARLFYLAHQFRPTLATRHWDEVCFSKIDFFLLSQIQEMTNYVLRKVEKSDDSPEQRLPVANVGVCQVETS